MLAKMKRTLAGLMAVVMVIGLIPMAVFASSSKWENKHRSSNFEYHIVDGAVEGLKDLCYELEPDTARPDTIDTFRLINDDGDQSKKFDDMGGHYNFSVIWGLYGGFIEKKFKPSRIETLQLKCDTKTYNIPVSELELMYFNDTTEFYEIYAKGTGVGEEAPAPGDGKVVGSTILSFDYEVQGGSIEAVAEQMLRDSIDLEGDYFSLKGLTYTLEGNKLTLRYTQAALNVLVLNQLATAPSNSNYWTVDLSSVIPEALFDKSALTGSGLAQQQNVQLDKQELYFQYKKQDLEPPLVDYDIPVKYYVLNPQRGVPENGEDQGDANYFPNQRSGDYTVVNGMPGDLTSSGWKKLQNDQGKLVISKDWINNPEATDLIVPGQNALDAMSKDFDLGSTFGTNYEIVWYVVKAQRGQGNTGLDDNQNVVDVHVDGYVKGVETAVVYKPNFVTDQQNRTDSAKTGQEYTILDNTFNRPGHTFIGWNTQADGKGTSYSAEEKITTLKAGMDLYAQWRPDAPTIEEVKGLVAAGVRDVTANINHGQENTSPLIDGTYTVSEVTTNDLGKYIVNVSVSYTEYVAKYNTQYPGHTLTNDETQIVPLSYNETTGTWEKGTVTFHVACESVPAQPNNVTKLISTLVDCQNALVDHADMNFAKLLDGSYTMGAVTKGEDGTHTMTVTVTAAPYVNAYNENTPGHSLVGAQTQTVTLTHYGVQGWGTGSVTFAVRCETPVVEQPDVPTIDTVNALLDVALDCVNGDMSHTEKLFATLLDGSYTIGSVTGSEKDGYAVTVAVMLDKYLEAYNQEQSGHTANGATTKTVTLTYVDGTWTAATSTIAFEIKCETPVVPPQPPTQPELPSVSVMLDCINEQAGHADMNFAALLADSYTMGEVQGDAESGYTVGVTVALAQYLAAYNAVHGAHLSAVEDASKIITLTYSAEQGWSAGSATFAVRCETPVVEQPDVPTIDTVNALLDVFLRCTNELSGHTSMTFANLLADSYTIGQVAGDAQTGYTLDITVGLAQYLAAYNAAQTGHSLVATDVDSKTVTLSYVNGAWTVEVGTVAFDLVCETGTTGPGDGGDEDTDTDTDTDEDGGTTDIPGGDIPLGPGTIVPGPGGDINIDDSDIPLTDGKTEEDEIQIEESEVPLDAAPKTNDMGAMGLWAALMAVSVCGLTALELLKKKRSAK